MQILKSVSIAAMLLASGCATLGTNIDSRFTCRAPKGDCAPASVIDARATGTLEGARPALEAARPRAGIQPGDIARTGDRVMKIVFPAHVDESGILHDEAIAYAVVEAGDWKAAARTERSAQSATGQVRDALKASLAQPPAAPSRISENPVVSDDGPPLVSRAVLPSTLREAISGAKAPAIEGLDMLPPWHRRAPRSEDLVPPLIYPTPDAIAAARKLTEGAPSPNATPQPEPGKAPRP